MELEGFQNHKMNLKISKLSTSNTKINAFLICVHSGKIIFECSANILGFLSVENKHLSSILVYLN